MWDAGALLGEHSLATVGVTNLLLAPSLLQANLEGREQRQKDRVADTCSTTSPQTPAGKSRGGASDYEQV